MHSTQRGNEFAITWTSTVIVGLLYAALALPAAQGQSSTPQQTLQQYVADLQRDPDDNVLRKKIIQLALDMNPPPEVPAEARRHMSRGVAAVEDAKTKDDFLDACNEFRQALALAPWLPNGYRNLAIAQDKAGLYIEALASLNSYRRTKPAPPDVEWAEDLQSKIEYRRDKAAKESSPETIAAKQQSGYEDWLKQLDGAQWQNNLSDPGFCADNYIELHGQEIRVGWITVRPGAPTCHANPSLGEGWSIARATLNGHNFTYGDANSTSNGTISDDGQLIVIELFPSPSAPPIFKHSKSTYRRVRNPVWTIWNR